MAKTKSLTILGVRGLRVHERTPEGLMPDGSICCECLPADAAVQALLWEQSFDDNPRDADFEQRGRWRDVFRAAMKRYEKENKR